jgi:hypothetical protein
MGGSSRDRESTSLKQLSSGGHYAESRSSPKLKVQLEGGPERVSRHEMG